VLEWTDTIMSANTRNVRSGDFANSALSFEASYRIGLSPAGTNFSSQRGFRVASAYTVVAVPVPLVGPATIGVLSALIGLIGWRRLRS
jgi:hypothetical protein